MNKKGFTLVELLVVVVLVIGISVVAIVGLTGISDKRKEEQWENTKSMMEAAAKDYYKTNEYLFEDVNNADAYVTIGKLVEEGYLNKVVNPMTNKTVGYCNKVAITITNGKPTFKYEEDSRTNKADCQNAYQNNVFEIHTSKTIKASTAYKDEDGTVVSPDGSWFNISKLGEGRQLKLCVTPKSQVTSVKIDGTSYAAQINQEYCKLYSDGEYGNKEVYVKNVNGDYWKKVVSFKVDTLKPVCGVVFSGTPSASRWYTSDVTVSSSDKTGKVPASKIASNGVSTNENGPFNDSGTQTNTSSTTWYGKIISGANNAGTCSGTVKVDTDTPTCSIVFSGTVGDNGWYTSSGEVTVKATNTPTSGIYTNASGVSSSVNGIYKSKDEQNSDTKGTTWYGKVMSNTGAVGTCSAVIKVDSTPPTATIALPTSGNDAFYVTGSGSDSTSGVASYRFATSATATSPSYSATTNKNQYKSAHKHWVKANETPKSYILQVKDKAGNVGNSSKIAEYKACSSTTKEKNTDSSGEHAMVYRWRSVNNAGTASEKTDCSLHAKTTASDVLTAARNYNNNNSISEVTGPHLAIVMSDDDIRYCSCNWDEALFTEKESKELCSYDYGNKYTAHNDTYHAAMIVYHDNTNGQTACQNKSTSYVKYVCSSHIGSSAVPKHGLNFYGGASSNAVTIPIGAGTNNWVRNGSLKGDPTTAKAACEYACKGKVDY